MHASKFFSLNESTLFITLIFGLQLSTRPQHPKASRAWLNASCACPLHLQRGWLTLWVVIRPSAGDLISAAKTLSNATVPA